MNKSNYPQSIEKIFFDFMNATTDLIILADAKGDILFVNDAASQLYGLIPEKISDNNLFNFLSDTEISYVETLLSTAEPQYFEQKKNEGIFFYNYFPVTNDLRQISQIGIFIKNITKMRKLEEELLRIAEKECQRPNFDIYDYLEQHLVGMSYLLTTLKKKIGAYSIPEESLISKLEALNKEAIQKLKTIH